MNTTDRKMTWGDIWKNEPLRLSFRIRSVYDLLPTPANLCRWGLTDDPKCSLCDRPGTLEHVLSTCSTSLTQGRYRWRHDTVLRELADWLENERKKERGSNPKHHITFVNPGETMTRATHSKHQSLMALSNGTWKLTSGGDSQYHGRQDVKRPMRERKQSTPSLCTFADSEGGVPGCSPLK